VGGTAVVATVERSGSQPIETGYHVTLKLPEIADLHATLQSSPHHEAGVVPTAFVGLELAIVALLLCAGAAVRRGLRRRPRARPRAP
jgi:hypothetical protein